MIIRTRWSGDALSGIGYTNTLSMELPHLDSLPYLNGNLLQHDSCDWCLQSKWFQAGEPEQKITVVTSDSYVLSAETFAWICKVLLSKETESNSTLAYRSFLINDRNI